MKAETPVGIDEISFYSPKYYIELGAIATARGRDPNTYLVGLGQEKMAVPAPGEDVVTMAANAASTLLGNIDREQISTLIFATESGIDQSKAGGIYVHKLLGLPERCRVFEIKQACYGATAGLQMSIPMIKLQPDEKVLLIASDVARYGLGSAGEPTQGGGSVAMIISANPKLVTVDMDSGFYTEDVMDFWRPNYRDEALVDGKKSIRIYVKALLETWQQYQKKTNRNLLEFYRFCYHLPFTAMAETAHHRLLKSVNISLSTEELHSQIQDSLTYNKIMGNSYAASLYICLASLLDCSNGNLENKRIAFFSYGSGCMAEFFSGVVCDHYRQYLHDWQHNEMLRTRQALEYEEYEKFYSFSLPTDGRMFELPRYNTGMYRLAAMKDHKRIYELVNQEGG